MKCNVSGKECDIKILHGEGGRTYSVCHLTGTTKQSYPTNLTKCFKAV